MRRTSNFKNYTLYHTLGVVLIIVSSFFLFSTAFYPFVSSDDAMNVLMAHDFHLPADIYCWGQDRGGNLIQLISQLFIVPFGIPAIMAVSLSNYLVLTLGFLGFSTLLKDKRLIILIALLWFFPYQRFLQINAFYIGMGYSMLGFSLLFIQKLNWTKNLFTHLPNLIRLGLIGIIWLLAVWCSDLVFISLLTLGGTLILKEWAKNRSKLPSNVNWQGALAFVGILTFIFFILRKAKTYAVVKTKQFMTFNSLTDVVEALTEVKNQSLNVMLGSEDLLLTLGAWIVLALIILGIYYLIRFRKSIVRFENFWINFFLFDFFAMLLVIFLSHWVLLNEMGRWYFVAPYISFGLMFILLIDKSEALKSRKKYMLSIVIFLVLGSSSITNVLHFSDGKYESMPTKLADLNDLGEIGIIGNYWEAYRMSIANPDQIKATPMEGGGVRSQKLIGEVFAQPRIFISKDMWMQDFPDSLVQFGVTLHRKGKGQFLAGSTICEYEIQRTTQHYYLNDLKYLSEYFNSKTNTINLTSKQSEMKGKIVVFGPYTSILPGKYKLQISAVGEVLPKTAENIQFDIAHNHGIISSGFEPLTELSVEYTCEETIFEKTFETKELMQHVEFRLFVKEPVDFTFYKFELIPVK